MDRPTGGCGSTNILMAFSYILWPIAIVAGPGLRLDDAAGVGGKIARTSAGSATDAVTWTDGELKRVYES